MQDSATSIEREGRFCSSGDEDIQDSDVTEFMVSPKEDCLVFPSIEEIEDQIDTNLPIALKTNLKCIGGFSEDENKNFINDTSNLTFIDPRFASFDNSGEKEVELDLRIASDKAKSYTGTHRQSLSNLVCWISAYADLIKKEFAIQGRGSLPAESNRKYNIDFVCVKSTLCRILETPYSRKASLLFYAQCTNGTVYLMGYRQNLKISEKVTNWAHKFEQYLTGEDVTEGTVANKEYRCVMKTRFGEHSLLYSVTTDCADKNSYKDDAENLQAFFHLKCVSKQNMERLIRHKLFYWYFDCLLTSIDKLIVGFRDTKGRVRSLRMFKDEEMLQLGTEYWNPEIGITFLDRVLSFVKNVVKKYPGVAFKFERAKGTSRITAVREPIELNLLPEWFLEEHVLD